VREHTYQLFSLEEYQQRLDGLRSRMNDRGVDAMLINTPENLFYMTGYQTPGYYWYQTLIVPLEGEPVFITRLQEGTNIEPRTWVEESRPYNDNDDWIAKTRDTLKEWGLDRKRIGLEFKRFFITIDDFQRLNALLPEATFKDASGLVEQGRMIKSPQEIEYMRLAAKATEAATRAAIDATEVGVTENDVAAEVHAAQIRAGSEYTGLPLFISSGPRTDMVHATWYRRELQQNDSMLFEMVASYHRYHAAMFRPVYLGDPPDVVIKGAEVTIDTLQKAKAIIKPGTPVGDVHKLIQDNLVGRLGLATDWGEGHIISFYMDDPTPLQAGMTFHLIVPARVAPIPADGHYYSNRLDAQPVPCSDTILVTEDGCETLTGGVEHKLYVK